VWGWRFWFGLVGRRPSPGSANGRRYSAISSSAYAGLGAAPQHPRMTRFQIRELAIIGTDAVSVRARRVRAFDHALIRQRSANTLFVQIFAGSETLCSTTALKFWGKSHSCAAAVAIH